MTVPSTSSAGILPIGLFARNAGDLSPPSGICAASGSPFSRANSTTRAT